MQHSVGWYIIYGMLGRGVHSILDQHR